MGASEGIVWYLRTSDEELEGARLLVVEGRISSATAAELARVLAAQLADEPRNVVVDLTGVDYINGAGLRAFESAAASLNGSNGELIICGLQPPVQVAFELAGSIRNLTTAPSRDAALLRLRDRSNL